MRHGHGPASPGRPTRTTSRGDSPRTTADLRQWVRTAPVARRASTSRSCSDAVERVLGSQRQLLEESKHEAIRALSEGFAAKMARLQRQLTEKDVTVSNIARYFEEVVADLTEKSHRDPKTKLLNFDWFMERLESFLAVEQRVRWCGVGRRRHQQLQVVQRHARPRRPATDHRARRAHPLRSDPLRGLPGARARRRRRATCTPGSAATSSAS